MTRIAMCACGEPLVWTFGFSQKEFVCAHCGRLYTMFGPAGVDETPELLARLEANKARWEELSAGMLGGGVMLETCRNAGGKCSSEPHLFHASDEEIAAHNAAIERWEGLRA